MRVRRLVYAASSRFALAVGTSLSDVGGDELAVMTS